MGEHFRPERILHRFEPARLVVEVAQIVLHEGHEPDALADLRDADLLPGKSGAHSTRGGLLGAGHYTITAAGGLAGVAALILAARAARAQRARLSF